jgi:hypothetical protein
MRQHNMTFDKLPRGWTEAPHFGNAMVASMRAGVAIAAPVKKPLKVFILAGQANMQGHAAKSTLPDMADDPNGRPSLVVWLQHDATGPITFTLRGARPATSASIVKPMTWAAVSQVTTNPAAVTLSATALPGVGTEYLFECRAEAGKGKVETCRGS